jgi:RNA polymerase sigma-70 factor (ECF subfamily)
VKAWRNLASFRGGSAFGSWLHRVAVHVVLDEVRSRGRRPQAVPERDAEGPSGPAPLPSGPAPLDLERAVAALPEGARRIFVLHDVEGFRHEEIARLTGLAVGTSKAQLHRARTLLREALR